MKSESNKPRRRFAGTSSRSPIALACLLLVCNVKAQESPDPTPSVDTATVLTPVRVTGVKSSNAKTIAAKKQSAVVMDAIAADEIGKLPDFNVGDALKRVTGVNVLTYQGEPRFAIVRGLNGNYNTTLIDGFTFATADVGSRQALLEMLPANLAYRVEVTKSFSPESDGGAIGGVVNMLTASAFTYPDNTLTFDAKAGQNLMSSKYGGSTPIGEASGKWAKRFGGNNEFGIVTAASYWTRDIHVPQIETGSTLYTSNGTSTLASYGGTGVAVPAERRWYNYDNHRERASLTSRVDWQPGTNISGHASAFYFKQHEESNRNTQAAQIVSGTNPTTIAGQTATGGTLSPVSQLVELGRLRWDRDLYGINGEVKYDIDSKWTSVLRGSSSRSTVQNPQTWDRFTQSNLAYNYDWSGASPTFTPVSANASNPALYGVNYHREEATTYAQRVNDLQLKTQFNEGEDDRGLGLSFGGRFVSSDMNTDFDRTSWSGMPYNLSNVLASGSLCGMNCNSNLLLIDPSLADAAFNQYKGSATATVDTAAQFGGTYGVRENVSAAFVQSQLREDDWLIAGGLRLEHTALTTNGYKSISGVWTPADAQSSYRNLLPSLLGVLNTSATSKLRAGISQTIGRPRFDQLATRGGVLSSSAPYTLSQGNADLKPRKSNNFDLGHDWYLDQGKGIVSVGLFHKVIANEICTFGRTETLDVNGTPTPVLVTQARNVSDKVKLSGIEFGLTKDLDFLSPALKGLGVNLNATLTHAHYPVTLSDGSTKSLSALPQQPKQIWNVALYYDAATVHARVAWNHIGQLWDDRFPNYTPTGFYANRYQQQTNNVDVQVGYDVTPKTTVTLDILNLTGQGMKYSFGNKQEFLQSEWKLAPSVMLGVSYKL